MLAATIRAGAAVAVGRGAAEAVRTAAAACGGMRRNGPIPTRGNPIISSAFCQNAFHFRKFIAPVCFVPDGFLSDVAFLNFVGFLSWDEEP